MKCTVYCSNPGYFATVNAVYAEYFGAHKPARTFFCPGGWFGPFDIEFDCVALVDEQGPMTGLARTLLLIASATAYSTAGFFTRLIQVDAWTLLFWRGLFGGGFLAIIVVCPAARPAVAGDPRHGLGGRCWWRSARRSRRCAS